MKHYTVATCNPLRTTQSVNNVSLETTWTQISHLCSPFQHTFCQWVGNRALFPVQWSSPLMFRLWFMKSSVFHVQRSNHTQLCSLHPISFAQVKGTVCFFAGYVMAPLQRKMGIKYPNSLVAFLDETNVITDCEYMSLWLTLCNILPLFEISFHQTIGTGTVSKLI